MKIVGLMASAIAMSFLGCSSACAEDWPPASNYLVITKDCATNENPVRCQEINKSWQRDYDGAIKGNYQGQRNVAFCLSTGCGWTEMRKNPVLGCAWRIVIAKSGHLSADSTDASNLKLYCGAEFLDDNGRVMADAQARTILMKLRVAQ